MAHALRLQSKRNLFIGVGVAVATLLVGYIVVVSLAAGPVASVEAESAQLSSTGLRTNDPAASDSSAIRFGAVPAPDPDPTPGTETIFVAAAGDIADNNKERETSDLIVNDPAIQMVLALGDLAYSNGTTEEFNTKYDPTWGRFKNITKPTPGNHEYGTEGAQGYYDYWNGIAEYYDFAIGNWHAISLNSEINHEPDSPQLNWLNQNLQANASKQCTLAFWHTPRFSQGTHSDEASVGSFFEALYAADADLILAGHSHSYERFAPSDNSGQVDPARGIRSFVVGTGGSDLGGGGATDGSLEFGDYDSHGVLKLDLYDGGYDWRFVDISGATLDSGTGSCH